MKNSGRVQRAIDICGLRIVRLLKWLRVIAISLPMSHGVAQAGGGDNSSADAFSAYQLRVGKTASHEKCEAEPNAVWVSHAYGEECIHYYLSKGFEKRSGTVAVPVIFFHGDRLSALQPLGDYDKVSPRKLTQEMQRNFIDYGVPFILVARPGVFGSSGWHKERRRPKEFHSLNAAVDAIKQRYGLDRIVIAGQSGGSTVGGALLTLGRKDIACAVLGSGNYAVLELAQIKKFKENLRIRHGCDATSYCDSYNVIDFVGGIASDPARLIAIVGDPTDNNTVFPLQQKFADSIKSAGHSVQLIEAHGTGPDHHGLSHITYRLAAACALAAADGKSVARFDLAALVGTDTDAYALVPGSGFAKVDDVDAVPLGKTGRERYAHYLSLPTPKAFVITEKGGWYFYSEAPGAAQKALDLCPEDVPCWLYALDERVVWKPDPEERISSTTVIKNERSGDMPRTTPPVE